MLCSEATDGEPPESPERDRWPQVLGTAALAWPERQQLAVPAERFAVNLHEWDAYEYGKRDAGPKQPEQLVRQPLPAAPAPPSPSPSPPQAGPLQQKQFVLGPLGLGIRDQISLANSLHRCCKLGFPLGGSRMGEVTERLGHPVSPRMSSCVYPPAAPRGVLEQATAGLAAGHGSWGVTAPKGDRGTRGHVPSVPSPGQIRSTAITSPAAAARLRQAGMDPAKVSPYSFINSNL